VKQIVINLLTNAIKYTESGGRVELTARVTHEGIEIIVADSGIGMSREDLARALQPFGQAASALTRSQEGTGLGLNITQALVELHGGRLVINSAPGNGTTATVRLPLKRLVSAELPGKAAQG
jgi:signal transduction histidine kinase